MTYTQYDETLHGKFSYPEGFPELLEGRSLEQQLRFFRIGNGIYRNEPVTQRRKCACHYSCPLQDDERVEAVLLCENRVAGVLVRNCHGKVLPCLPEQGYIVRDDSELDGSGYKEHQLFRYLLCVSEAFDSADIDIPVDNTK